MAPRLMKAVASRQKKKTTPSRTAFQHANQLRKQLSTAQRQRIEKGIADIKSGVIKGASGRPVQLEDTAAARRAVQAVEKAAQTENKLALHFKETDERASALYESQKRGTLAALEKKANEQVNPDDPMAVINLFGRRLAAAEAKISTQAAALNSKIAAVKDNYGGEHVTSFKKQAALVQELNEAGVLSTGTFWEDLKNGMFKIGKFRLGIPTLAAALLAHVTMKYVVRDDAMSWDGAPESWYKEIFADHGAKTVIYDASFAANWFATTYGDADDIVDYLTGLGSTYSKVIYSGKAHPGRDLIEIDGSVICGHLIYKVDGADPVTPSTSWETVATSDLNNLDAYLRMGFLKWRLKETSSGLKLDFWRDFQQGAIMAAVDLDDYIKPTITDVTSAGIRTITLTIEFDDEVTVVDAGPPIVTTIYRLYGYIPDCHEQYHQQNRGYIQGTINLNTLTNFAALVAAGQLSPLAVGLVPFLKPLWERLLVGQNTNYVQVP